MRFDLEIANLHTDLVYISENQEIPAGAVPLYFVNMDTRDKVPSDFFSIENNILQDSLAGQGYQSVEGPAFPVNSNKFALTHVSTYSVQGSAKVPLFFKHVIADRVHEDAIRIVDYFGIQIPREEYMVEEKKDFTNIYINKYNKILFVEYVSDTQIYKKLLDLQPVFTEIGWEDFVVLDTNVPEYKYISTDNFVQTSYPGTMYISYKYETDLLRMPACNIEDDWFVSILNANFEIEKVITGIHQKFRYSVPEYYIQQTGNDRYYKHFVHKKVRKLFDNYIKLQTPILRERAESIYIYVYDFYTNKLKHAITTNHAYEGKYYKDDVYYLYTNDYNADGVIGLPVRLTDRDVAYADYHIFDEYYEFRFLNLNSPTLNSGGYFGIFLVPDVTELEEAVYFARIGIPRTVPILIDGIITQDMQFETLDEYDAFLDEYNCYGIAVISIFGNYEASVLNTKDARTEGGQIFDRKLACLTTADMIYKDLIDGKISIPTNDTLIANIDADALTFREVLKIDTGSNELNIESKEFLTKLRKTVQSSLDTSTMPIVDVTYTNSKPANNSIVTTEVQTIHGWEPQPDTREIVMLSIAVPQVNSGFLSLTYTSNVTGQIETITNNTNQTLFLSDIPYYKDSQISFTAEYQYWFNSVLINGVTVISIDSNDGSTVFPYVITGDTTFAFSFGD
jgi:hypothetical protein